MEPESTSLTLPLTSLWHIRRVEFDVTRGAILRKIHLTSHMCSFVSSSLRDSRAHILSHRGSASMSPQGDIVLHNIRDGLEIYRLDANGATAVCSIPLKTRKRIPMRPSFLPGNPMYVLSHTQDQAIRIWHARTGEETFAWTARSGKCGLVVRQPVLF